MSLLSVISKEMTNDQLVHREYVDDLNTKSQLIVYESQEAIFFKNGQALDLFGSGRHTLDTSNIPILKRLVGGLFGGKTPFPCDIYFINKVCVLDFIWGTDAPIDLADPKYSMLVGVRANGQTGIRIVDSRKFVVKVAGMMNEYTVDTLKRTIKGLMMPFIKESIASAIIEKGISILEITPRLSEIGDGIQKKLNERIADLGIELVHFSVNAIMASDGDLAALKKAKSDMMSGMNMADIEAYKMKVMSEARARAREAEGYTYQDERKFDVLESAAKNEGASAGFLNLGVGLGVGTGVGMEVGKMTQAITNQTPTATAGSTCSGCGNPMDASAKFCPNCGKQRPVVKFCPECGTEATPGSKFCANCGNKLI